MCLGVFHAQNEIHKKDRANKNTSRLDRKDSEVSPGTLPSKPQPSNSRANIAPWDSEPPSSEPAKSQSGNVPSINRQPPSASPNEKSGQMPTSVFGTFYNDSSENLGTVSPGHAPQNGMSFPNDGDARRPSIASATTVSSSGSRSHKKLQGFFGEEYKAFEETSRQGSETSSMQGNLPPFAPGGGGPRDRTNSTNEASMRSGSPSSSRPRTPAQGPTNEVTPWVFQDSKVGWLTELGRTFQANADACYRTHPPELPTRPFPSRATAAAHRKAHPIPTDCTCPVTDTIAAMRRGRARAKVPPFDLQRAESSPSPCVVMAVRAPWPRQ